MAESKVKKENFIVIQGFMVSDLKLKGNELIVYAIIYGFSQAEGITFNGSLQYLADWLNASKQTVINSLKSLIEKDLIGKKENYTNGVKFCEYYSKNLNGVVKNFEGGSQKICIGGSQKNLTNNISLDIKEDNKDINKETFVSLIKDFTENVDLTDSLKEYVEMRKKMNKGFTTRALKQNLNELNKLAIDDITKNEIVNQSIVNTWKSFYPLKNKQERKRAF